MVNLTKDTSVKGTILEGKCMEDLICYKLRKRRKLASFELA